MNRLNQLVEHDRNAFQHNSKIQYDLHRVFGIETMNKVCAHCNACSRRSYKRATHNTNW